VNHATADLRLFAVVSLLLVAITVSVTLVQLWSLSWFWLQSMQRELATRSALGATPHTLLAYTLLTCLKGPVLVPGASVTASGFRQRHLDLSPRLCRPTIDRVAKRSR